ncbi:MAG: stage II sporulation protein R [Negativicutes bacterium]|nr:stage II sporulation protein R [Negativicutes bacterium]
MRRKAKRLVTLIVVLFMIAGWILLLEESPGRPTGTGAGELIRLHILANSDSPEDQRVKLQVRDAVNNYLAPLLSEAPTAGAARQIVAEQREGILEVARAEVRRSGASYPVAMETGWFDFPLRSYGTLVLPAGRYEAVRILLGEGRGANWWCVLFPPLCFVDATGAVAVPASASDPSAQSGKVQLRWKVLELWEGKPNP